jgi:hypothetical protein
MIEIDEISGDLLKAITTQWTPGIESEDFTESTWWYGVMQKCSKGAERLLEICVGTLLSILVDEGLQIAQTTTSGKPLDLMTMGERVQLLERLDEKASLILQQKYPSLQLQCRLIGKDGIRTLHRISRIRNDFVHGRFARESQKEMTLEFLSCTEKLCRSRLVSTVSAYQRHVKG